MRRRILERDEPYWNRQPFKTAKAIKRKTRIIALNAKNVVTSSAATTARVHFMLKGAAFRAGLPSKKRKTQDHLALPLLPPEGPVSCV